MFLLNDENTLGNHVHVGAPWMNTIFKLLRRIDSTERFTTQETMYTCDITIIRFGGHSAKKCAKPRMAIDSHTWS